MKRQLLAGIAASPREAHFAAGWSPRRSSKHGFSNPRAEEVGAQCDGEGKAAQGGCKIFPGHKRVA